MSTISLRLRTALQRIQSKLDFEGWTTYPQFSSKFGLGRVAMLACILGILLGIHLVLVLLILLYQFDIVTMQQSSSLWTNARIQLLMQWSLYVVFVCTFHLLEFFVTALYNPTETSSNAFLINHSIAYTAAALLSWTEFAIHFWFLPQFCIRYMTSLGLVMIVVAQCIRTCAMVTCGQSFNHLIQLSKKDNHILITHGIYKWLRHPSYVGFYYWAVGTQLLLGNVVHTVVFAIVACAFFRRRIPYEEEALMQLFPQEYPAYANRTWIGIPFVCSTVAAASTMTTTSASR